MTENTVIVKMSRKVAMRMLCDAMSQASESVHCASWLSGLEDRLPPIAREIVRTQKVYSGWDDDLTVEEAQCMCNLADALGHWVVPSFGEGPDPILPHVPISERKDST